MSTNNVPNTTSDLSKIYEQSQDQPQTQLVKKHKQNQKQKMMLNFNAPVLEPSFMMKYQPHVLQDFELDKDIFDIFTMLIQMDSVNVLILGDHGSGKTSIINALVRAIYKDTPVNNAISDQSVLYVNNLSDQGIQYYRTHVKTFCQTTSGIRGKKKVLILDDLDTITENNQQAFRTRIDKYQHNVHFICSCTDTNKIIDSIQSRLTIIKLRPLSYDNMIRIYDKITTAENMVHRISDDAKKLLIQSANNSPRMLINYLEKINILDMDRIIDKNDIPDICTVIHHNTFEKYTRAIFEDRDLHTGVKLLYKIYDNGYSVMDILDNYFLYIKSTNIIQEDLKYSILPFICKYIVVFHTIHESEIELALFSNQLLSSINNGE
jgi:DNA polymerase III delta prime subunit